MKKRKQYRELLEYMIPATTGLLVIALYVIIDSAFVGRGIGKEALAALNIAYPMVNVATSLSMMVGMGASTLMTLYARKKQLSALALSYIHVLNVLMYLVLAALVFGATDFLFALLGGDESLKDLVLAYLYPSCIGWVFLMVSTGWNAAVRNLGAPRYAFFSMLAGGICNIFFDWFFLFPCQMGIQGAAIASSMGQLLSFVLLLVFFYKRGIQIPFWPKRFSARLLAGIYGLGFSSFVMEFASGVVTLVIFNMQFLYYGGEMAVASFCIVASSFYFFRMLFTGMGQGMQPVISKYFERKDGPAVLGAYETARGLSLSIAGLSLLGIFFFKEGMMSMYHKDPVFVAYSARGFLLYATASLPMAYSMISISYYQAIGNGRVANLFSLFRSVFFLLIYVFILPRILGITGLWLVLTATETSTALLIFIYQRRKK